MKITESFMLKEFYPKYDKVFEIIRPEINLRFSGDWLKMQLLVWIRGRKDELGFLQCIVKKNNTRYVAKCIIRPRVKNFKHSKTVEHLFIITKKEI